MLPIHEKKKPPKQMDIAVCLLTQGERIYVTRREQRMLNGLYVFRLIEEETAPDRVRVRVLLSEDGFDCRFQAHMGTAKHVFTHRVWNMHILHYELLNAPENAQLVTLEQMEQLPFPTAVKAAVEAARKLLSGQG